MRFVLPVAIFLGLVALLTVIACDGRFKDSRVVPSSPEVPGAPPGAKLVRDLGEHWYIWQVDGLCFLSQNLSFNSAVLAPIPCPL